mgnify:CR=1 FL=1
MSERLQWAKWFIEHGFAIFPLAKETKKPVIKGWEKYSSEPLTEEEKKEFLKKVEEGYNFAVPCGQKNLVVLDIEDYEIARQWFGSQNLQVICETTLCVKTPHGGLHIYLIADKTDDVPPHKFNPAFMLKFKDREPTNIADLQSFKSYVVAPGSCINHLHCETDKCQFRGQDITTCYEVVGDKDIAKVDLKAFLRELVKLGESMYNNMKVVPSPSLRAWLGLDENGGQRSGERAEKDTGEESKKRCPLTLDQVEELAEKLKEQSRYHDPEQAKKDLCSALRQDSPVYKVVCEGKTYAELGVTDRSAMDFRVILTMMQYGITDKDVILELMPPDSKTVKNEKWDPYKYFLQTLCSAWFTLPKVKELTVAMKQDKTNAKNVLINMVVEDILEDHDIATFVVREPSEQYEVGIFIFNKEKGIYEPIDIDIDTMVREYLDIYKDFSIFFDKNRVVKNVIDEIKAKTRREIPEEPLRIAFPNGTIEWLEDWFIWYPKEERSSKVFSFYYVPWELKVNEIMKFKDKDITVQDIEDLAKRLCPKFLEVFKKWAGDRWVLLFEIIGYVLYPGIRFRKAFMLKGKTGAGKSAFNTIFEKLVPGYTQSISIYDLFNPNNRFVLHDLYHKLVNATTETKEYTLQSMDRFKQLTGGDWITADRKFKRSIRFKPIAKLVVATNNMPKVTDTSDDAFWRRWIIIPFNGEFQDNDMWIAKLVNDPNEMSGLVTVGVLALLRVFRQGRFDFDQSVSEVRRIWLESTDTVVAFVNEYVRRGILVLNPSNDELVTDLNELYNLYVKYCRETFVTSVGLKKFVRSLRENFGLTVSRFNDDDDYAEDEESQPRVRAYVRGIAINQTYVAPVKNVAVTDVKEFIDYIAMHDGQEKTLDELLEDFNYDRAKVNKLLSFCITKNFCRQLAIDRYLFTF